MALKSEAFQDLYQVWSQLGGLHIPLNPAPCQMRGMDWKKSELFKGFLGAMQGKANVRTKMII